MGLAAFNRMRRNRKNKAEREAKWAREAETKLKTEQKLTAEAEKLGVDPELYMMDSNQLDQYAQINYDTGLDRRRKHIDLVKEVMELRQAKEKAGNEETEAPVKELKPEPPLIVPDEIETADEIKVQEEVADAPG